MQLINSRCRTGEYTAKSFHRFQNYSLSDPPCYAVGHIAEFRFRFIMCLCTLKRLTHQLFLIKTLQSQPHLDAERTDFSARHLPFSDPSIQASVCSEKASCSKKTLETSHSFLSCRVYMSDGGSHARVQTGRFYAHLYSEVLYSMPGIIPFPLPQIT